jgi:hypothetical protein
MCASRALGAFLQFALVVLAVTVVMGLVASVTMAAGAVRVRRGAGARADLTTAGLLAAGSALAVPPVWMLASFLLHRFA